MNKITSIESYHVGQEKVFIDSLNELPLKDGELIRVYFPRTTIESKVIIKNISIELPNKVKILRQEAYIEYFNDNLGITSHIPINKLSAERVSNKNSCLTLEHNSSDKSIFVCYSDYKKRFEYDTDGWLICNTISPKHATFDEKHPSFNLLLKILIKTQLFL